jgi:subfamily B ATP-binding cassette protein MsbA
MKKQKKQKKQSRKQKTGLKVYRRLLNYVIPYKGLFFISFLGFMLASATQPLFAEMIRHIIDTLQTEDRKGALQLPLLFCGLIVVRSLGVFVGSYFVTRVSANVVHDLRCEIFNHYTRLPTGYFDSNNSGYLISRITNNVQQVTAASTDALKTMIREGMTAIGLLGYLFYINWQLSLVFLSIAPVIAIVVTVVSKRLRRLSKRLQESVGDLTQIASEVVGGHRIVKSYGGEVYERKRFRKQSSYHRNQTMKLSVTSALQNPIMQIIVAVALSGLMYFALLLMEKSSTGEFVAYLTAAFMLPRAIRFISNANAKIQKGIAAAESLFEVLDEPAEKNEGTKVISGCQGEIEFRNVSFRYKGSDRQALKNVSFKIRSGQAVALVGASGSGKTTLVNLLMRFYDHTKGQILIDGSEINTIKIESLREQVALVTQNITLFDDTVKNNIGYGSDDPNEQWVIKAAEDAFAMEFIEKLEHGLEAQIGEHGVKLSGGQCQRMALARAFYKSAPILILDEATSALDTKSERFIQSALERIQKSRTSIVIAHRLSTIEKAEVIFVMDDGEIVERGNHKELISLGGVYAQLHSVLSEMPTHPIDKNNSQNEAGKSR